MPIQVVDVRAPGDEVLARDNPEVWVIGRARLHSALDEGDVRGRTASGQVPCLWHPDLMRKLYPGSGSLAIVDRLEDSADHVGGYSYTGSLCDGRGINVYMGCGRLDAYGALN